MWISGHSARDNAQTTLESSPSKRPGTASIAWESFKQHAFSPWWMALSVAAFAGIAAYHFRIIRARNLAQRAVTFYQSGLARMENRWPGTGQTGERFSDPHHVYAADLDL